MKTWSIQYTDKVSGSKHYYMNTGFKSPKEAKEELERILRHEDDMRERDIPESEFKRKDYKIVERNYDKRTNNSNEIIGHGRPRKNGY